MFWMYGNPLEIVLIFVKTKGKLRNWATENTCFVYVFLRYWFFITGYNFTSLNEKKVSPYWLQYFPPCILASKWICRFTDSYIKLLPMGTTLEWLNLVNIFGTYFPNSIFIIILLFASRISKWLLWLPSTEVYNKNSVCILCTSNLNW